MLPWSEQAGANAAVAGRFSRALPFVGRWLETFVLGGSVPTSRTLERAFGFHAALLPAALTAAVSLHVVAIAAAPTGDGHRSRRIEAAAAAALAATVVLALAMTWPPVAGEAFDVARATSGAKPLWFAWPIHALLAVAPTRVLSVDGDKAVATGVVAVLTALLALPFLRKPSA
jgi:quinol-cytochrome oxidoreductase complex cytochrome b subunit